MQPPTKQAVSLDQPPASCSHIFHAQTQHPPLPPLYIISAPTSSYRTPSLRPSTITRLARALVDLGTPHTHTPFLSHDIVTLRRELEGGMARERRQQMQFYILGIADNRRRAAAELYLARYKGFVLGADGRLMYGLEEESAGGEREGGGSNGLGGSEARDWRGAAGSCGVM